MEGRNVLFRGLVLLAALALLMLLVPALSADEQAKAESVAQSICVIIPETIRLNINQNSLLFSERRQGEPDALYPPADQEKVLLKVLSNSQRLWQLRVNASSAKGLLEWSTDGKNWGTVNGSQEILSGHLTNGWKEFAVYYRLRQADERTDETQLEFTYDLTTVK